ncbi:hypothetical protein U9M48_022170 [Paspalum notatum var. saurae]|uniref:Zinc finger GRF-type domain-containing protein n=1 Tax=Paspalum notatum var. saurae TaxID=547442 RepID=A0AAQ3TH58_PASNO
MASSTTLRESVNNAWCFGEGGNRKSPISYRTGPLDYTPYVACKCGQKAALWISWSNNNPGHRYLKYYRVRSGGCDFIAWYEGRVESLFVHGLLVDLLDIVWELKKEQVELKDQLSDAVKNTEEQKLRMGRLLVAMEEGGHRDGDSDKNEMVQKKRPWLIAMWFAIAIVVVFKLVIMSQI